MKRPSVVERLVVGFAFASAGIGLLLAVGIGSLFVFLGSGGGLLAGFLGPRSTSWWLTAAGVWILLSGVVAVLVARRDLAAKNDGKMGGDE